MCQLRNSAILCALCLLARAQQSLIPRVVSLFTFEATLTSTTMSTDALAPANRGLFLNGAMLSKQMGHNNDVSGDSVRLGTKLASVSVAQPPSLGAFGFYISMWLKVETTSSFPMKLVSSFEAFSLDMNSPRLLSLSLAGAVSVAGPRDTDFRVVDEWMFLLVGFHKPSMTVLRAFIDSANVRFDALPVSAAEGWGDIPLCSKPYVIGANNGANANMGKLRDGPIGLVDDVARFDVQSAAQIMTPDLANAIADGSLFRAVLTSQPTDAFVPRTGATSSTTRLVIAPASTFAMQRATPEPSLSDMDGDNGNSGAIIAGAVVGAVILAAAVVALAWFLVRNFDRRRHQMPAGGEPQALGEQRKAQPPEQAVVIDVPAARKYSKHAVIHYHSSPGGYSALSHEEVKR